MKSFHVNEEHPNQPLIPHAEESVRQEMLEFTHPLYFIRENTPIGWLSQLALEAGNWIFTAVHNNDDLYTVTHESGVSFLAELKEGKGKEKGTYSIKGCVQNVNHPGNSFFEGINIHGVGDNGWRLRAAQLGATYSLLAHWSLTNDVSTVVLPTGTGKTETMLVATLIDQAERTLVVVPTLDLKDQIAEKILTWGMLRELGVIPQNSPNPKVLVLSKTLPDISAIDILKNADVVISTPALLARITDEVKNNLMNIFSHVYFDEAHHVVANEWRAIKTIFKESKIVQFTATPYRNDRQPIEGNIVYNYPLSHALKDGCFASISLITVDERHPKKKDKAIADAAMERLQADRKNGFNLTRYALSQPYINAVENVFYFTTQKREKVKWARTKEMRDQKWDLVVLHHDAANHLLYVGYSEKRLDVDFLVEKIADASATAIKGDRVFRSFDAIKRMCIVHAGIFKPANHLHRYSRLSGADVTTELSRWKTEGRCDKSDFVGVGFRDGFPVSIGASVKGKIWSPARVGDLKEWKAWCLEIGRMITDDAIDSNLLLEDSAKKKHISAYPDVVVLAADWTDSLYNRIHKITLDLPNRKSFLLSEATLKHTGFNKNKANFSLSIIEELLSFSIVLGGEKGHHVEGLANCEIKVDGLKAISLSLAQFFQENPPTLFLLNGCTISGCVHTDYGECDIQDLPKEQIEVLAWDDVDFTIESHYKSNNPRTNSIQEYMMQQSVKRGAKVVFNDDNAGESADIVAVFVNDGLLRFELIHCKYSKATSGTRLSDLYEVCGQAIVFLRYKWKPEELIKHLERRNATGVLKDKRFYHGSLGTLEEIKKALKYSDVKFEFAIAQPGVKASALNPDMMRLLGSVYSTVVEMTETKLRCYFNS